VRISDGALMGPCSKLIPTLLMMLVNGA